MAEAYAKLNARQYRHNDGIGLCTSKEEVKEAYLAGLKAGKPKWHKVADGDLPKSKGAVLSDKGEFVYYNSFAQNLVDETYTEQTDIIAWCEIPKYTEE